MESAERCLPVVDFEGLYEVSDLGRVRSLDRTATHETTCRWSGATLTVERFYPGRVLRPGTRDSGHQVVILGRGNTRQVHALVLTAFVGPCPVGEECLHGYGDPANNRLGNLRWGTRLENVADTYRHGTRRHGETHPGAKLSDAQVLAIRQAVVGRSFAEVAREFGICGGTVRQIALRETWQHLPVQLIDRAADADSRDDGTPEQHSEAA